MKAICEVQSVKVKFNETFGHLRYCSRDHKQRLENSLIIFYWVNNISVKLRNTFYNFIETTLNINLYFVEKNIDVKLFSIYC